MTQPTIVLNMIVKDEAPIIESCLRTVLPLIDAWAIMDTGSSDETIEIIQRVMTDVPGRLGKMKWEGFADSRNAAISLAQGLGDYLLFLDADDKATWTGTVESVKTQLVHDLHHGTLVQGNNRYGRLIFRRNTSRSRYRGVIHEVLIPHKTDIVGPAIEGFVIERGAVGIGNRSIAGKEKYRRDAEMLETALSNNTDPDFTERYRFYLAQSYRDCGEIEKSIENYRLRLDMPGGYQQERYVSAINLGSLLEHTGASVEEQLFVLFEAREIDPHRAEAHHRIAELARKNDMWHLAFEHAVRARDIVTPPDRLFIDVSVPEWKAQFEISVAAWYVGEKKVGLDACDLLLKSPHTPPEIKAMTEQNRIHYTGVDG